MHTYVDQLKTFEADGQFTRVPTPDRVTRLKQMIPN